MMPYCLGAHELSVRPCAQVSKWSGSPWSEESRKAFASGYKEATAG
ncbi:unnamed protein product, partial [Staurois parvus]